MEEVGRDERACFPPAGVSSDGFDEFVQCHYGPLAKALALMTLDRQTAADAAHDAFLRLQVRWDGADCPNDPVAWLYRVGINRCRDYRRQLARAARLLERLVAGVAASPPGALEPSPDWAPDFEFSSLVRGLPKQQRVAAVLFYEADLSTAEIARVMGISEGAVKSHLFRAREALRPLVGGD